MGPGINGMSVDGMLETAWMLDMQQKLEHRQMAKHRAQQLREGFLAFDENAVWRNCVSVGHERCTERRMVHALGRWQVIRGYRSTPLRLCLAPEADGSLGLIVHAHSVTFSTPQISLKSLPGYGVYRQRLS